MDLGLKGRVALVTGASSGLGLASATALAAEGAHVAMLGRREDLLGREAARVGGLAVPGDVTAPADLERAVEATLAAYGTIDILVWNGGGPPPGRATDVTPETAEQAVALLFLPAVRLVHLCLPHLRRSAGGRVVAITSSSAKEPIDHIALSSAFRPAVTGWLKTLSRELGRHHRQLRRARPDRHRPPRAALPARRHRRRLRRYPAPPLGDAGRARGRRLLPRVRPRALCHRPDDPGRRRAHPGVVLSRSVP